MRNLMSDQQYQAFASRVAGANNLPSPVLHVRSHPQSAPYLSRKPYGDRVLAAVDPYRPGVETFSLAASAGSLPQIPQPFIVDRRPLSPEIRAQLTAERHSLPPRALIDYGPPPASSDYIRSKSMHEVPPVTYPGQFDSPLRHTQVLPTGSKIAPSSDYLARTRQRDLTPPYSSNGHGSGMRRLAPLHPYEDRGGFAAEPGPGGSLRRGQELDQYLLAVKPEKFVRYAASCFAPEPPLRLDRNLPFLGSHINGDDDVYSNYRRAKARRMESNGFRSTSPSSRRDREREPDRERKRGGGGGGGAGASRDPAKSSPNRNSKNGTGPARNGSQTSEGIGCRGGIGSQKHKIQVSDGENAKRLLAPNGNEARVERTNLKEEDGNQESEKDSELGSLCADLSDPEVEEAKKSAARASTVADAPLPGMIFGCSSATFHECMRLRLFGLPARNKSDVMRVVPGTKVFLFNFDTKELSGIFEATSHGGWQIQRDAFREFGAFPAQVQVCCLEQCPNVPQSLFRPVIRENYISQTKFKFDLNSKQVKDLTKLFRKAARERSRRQIDLAERFRTARPPFGDYSAIGEQQQFLFHR